MITKKTITHKGEKYVWKSFFANGSYYENEAGYVLTNNKDDVDFASVHALKFREVKNEICKGTNSLE